MYLTYYVHVTYVQTCVIYNVCVVCTYVHRHDCMRMYIHMYRVVVQLRILLPLATELFKYMFLSLYYAVHSLPCHSHSHSCR